MDQSRAAGNAPAEVDGSRRISQVIASSLRQRIVRGEIPPDAPLPSEITLTGSFGVSREVVREALGILEAESLIRVKRGRNGGPVARRPDLQAPGRYVSLLLQERGCDTHTLHEAIDVLERPGIQLLLEQIPPGTAERLATSVELARAGEGDPAGFAAAVRDFEQTLAEASGNRTLAVLTSILLDANAGAMFEALRGPMARARDVRRIVDAQAAVATAISREDGSAALDGWGAYRAAIGELIGAGRSSRTVIDVVPWWFATHARQRGAQGGTRLASSMALEIRARIARGALRDGDHLPSLAELGAEFGASRPSIREALRILENEQLVVLRPGSRTGPTVQPASTTVAARMAGIALELRGATIGDNWEARTLVEPTILEMATARIRPPTVRELHEICARGRELLFDNEAFMRNGMDFRFTALNAADNPALAVTLEIHRWVATGSVRAMNEALMPWEVRTHRRVLASYEQLVVAIEAGAADEVGDMWRQHVSTYLVPFRGQLGERLIVDVLDY